MRSRRPLLRPSLTWLLVFLPVSLAAGLAHLSLLVFLSAAAAIIPLAGLIGRATDQLAIRTGPRLGGLLNATFGNLTELIVAVLLVVAGDLEIVKASLIGSIVGNLLLVLGLSFFVGGLARKEQTFNARAAGVHCASLLLAVAGLAVPVLLVSGPTHLGVEQKEIVSGAVAGILIVLYLAALLFMQVTHESLFRTPGPSEVARWSSRRAAGVLFGAAVLVGLESELLVSALHPALGSIGLSPIFVGLILIPVIGNAAEHSSAILFALRDKLDVTVEIAVGSSTQVALFVAPAVVFISLATGHPMDFIFTVFQVGAVFLATLVVSLIAFDGRSNWLEGLQLIGLYVMIAVAAFFL